MVDQFGERPPIKIGDEAREVLTPGSFLPEVKGQGLKPPSHTDLLKDPFDFRAIKDVREKLQDIQKGTVKDQALRLQAVISECLERARVNSQELNESNPGLLKKIISALGMRPSKEGLLDLITQDAQNIEEAYRVLPSGHHLKVEVNPEAAAKLRDPNGQLPDCLKEERSDKRILYTTHIARLTDSDTIRQEESQLSPGSTLTKPNLRMIISPHGEPFLAIQQVTRNNVINTGISLRLGDITGINVVQDTLRKS